MDTIGMYVCIRDFILLDCRGVLRLFEIFKAVLPVFF